MRKEDRKEGKYVRI
ncbi:uncharacterized protein ACO6RY_16586 [Pungitius sinensis]